MSRFPAAVAVLGLVVAAGGLFSACNFFPAPCIQPFPTASLQAVVRIPVPVGTERTMVGACGDWVEYDGRQYTATFPNPRNAWAIQLTDLERIGKATGRTARVPVADADVFAIKGIDPADAVAMRGPSSGTFVVLTESRLTDFPPELCRYLGEGGAVSGCRSVRESP